MNEELIALYYNIDRYYPGALQGDPSSFAEFFGSNQAALKGFLDTAETQYPKAFQNYTEPSSTGRERMQDVGVDPMNWMAANPDGGEFIRPNKTGPKSPAEIMNAVFPLPTREIKAAQARKAQEALVAQGPEVSLAATLPGPGDRFKSGPTYLTRTQRTNAEVKQAEKDALPEVLKGQELANIYPEQLLPLYDRRRAASEQDKAGLAQAGEDAVFGKNPVMLTARKQPVVTRGGEWYELKQPELTGDDAESNLRFILATTPLQKEDIMKATGIEGLTYEELLRVKDFIAADDKIRANEHLRALDLYTKAINSKIENTPDEIRAAYDVLGSISGKTELSNEEMQAARNAAQIIQDNPEAAKAYEDAISSAQNAQKGYSNVQQKYPDVKLADDMNRMIQEGAKSDKISQAWQVGRTLLFGPLAPIAEVAGRPLVEAAKAYEDKISQAWQVGKTLPFGPLAPIAEVVGRPLVEAVPRLWGSLSSTMDSELAMGGDQGAASREIRRSLARRPYGTFRDSDSALRPIREKTATFNYDGKEYEMGFDNGVPTEIYDKETGNIAPLGLDVKENLMQEAMATKLEASGSYKLNTDAIVNTIQDVSSDLLGTFALAAATEGLGSGAVLSRVREMGAVMLQFQGRYVEDGLRKGMNMDQAVRYGRLMASIEGASEMVFPNISKVVDGPVAGNVADAVRRVVAGSDTKLVNAFARKEVLRALAGIPQEGAEELLVDWATPVANELVNNLSNTELDTEMPSIAKQIETFAIGAAVSVIPNLIGGVRARNWARDNRSLEESVLQAVRNLDDVKALAETGAIPQLETLLPVLENVARRASVDLEDKSLTGKQLSKRVAALFDDELAKKDRTDTTGTPDESKAEKAAKDAEKAVEESYKAEGDPAPKTFVDFDNTLWDNANQRLTPLGEEMKRRIANGDDITVLTAREDADGSDTAFIAEKLGISPDNVKTNLSPEEKAAELTDGSTYIDDKAENRDAAAARNVPGIQIVNPADLPGNPSVITENDSQNTQRISGEVQGGQESGGPIQDQGPGGEAAQTGGNVQAPQEVVAPRIQYTPVTDSEFSAFEDTEQVTPERKQMIAQRIASGEILSDTEEVMRQAVADEVQTLVDGMQNEAIAGVTQELSNAPIQATSLKTLAPILQKVFGLTKRGQASNTAKLMDRMIERMAERAGISKKKMYGRISFQQVTEEEMKAIREGNGEQLLEDQKDVKHRAAVQLLSDGRAIIYAISSPNVSSPLHELAHIYRQFLQSEEIDAILKQYYGKSELGENDVWNRDVEEFFARGFERYLYEGAVSNKTMRDIYDKFKKWLADIYNDFLGSEIDVPINDQMRAIYAAMLGEGVIGFSNRELSQDERVVNNALNNIFGTPLFQILGEKGAKALDQKAGVTTNIDNLTKAQKLQSEGVPAKTIRLATGWELGVDGKWRYEIKDDFTVKPLKGKKGKSSVYDLSQILDFPELFTAYPKFRTIPVKITPDIKGASYVSPGYNTAVSTDRPLGFIELPALPKTREEATLLLHEVQHAIQEVEGFAKGANITLPEDHPLTVARRKTKQELDRVRKAEGATMEEVDKAFEAYMTAYKAAFAEGVRLYKISAGENEANNVVSRVNMTAEERANTLLAATENVAREDQDVIGIAPNKQQSAEGRIRTTFETGDIRVEATKSVDNAIGKLGEEYTVEDRDRILATIELPAAKRIQQLEKNNVTGGADGQLEGQIDRMLKGIEQKSEEGYLNIRVLAGFGQEWNTGKYTPTELNWLRVALAGEKGSEIVARYLVKLNPQLLDIIPAKKLPPVGAAWPRNIDWDIIGGVSSGLHLNDIKVFVSDRAEASEALYAKVRKKAIELGGDRESVGFKLSEETANRIVNNQPYYKQQSINEKDQAGTVDGVSQAGEQESSPNDEVWTKAASVLRGDATAASDNRRPREGQEQALEAFAKKEGIWYEDLQDTYGDRFLAAGSESRVYVDPDGVHVIKGNEGDPLIYEDWRQMLDGIAAHNRLFPGEVLKILGFGNVTDLGGEKKFGIVLQQPYVRDAKRATREEIDSDMAKRGFFPEKSILNNSVIYGSYYNPTLQIRISDLHGKNVLKDSEGNFRYIDTQIFDTSDEVADERKTIERQSRISAQWLQAPNGEPTNLTDEQWVTVRTKAFKDWFGDWENPTVTLRGKDLTELFDKAGISFKYLGELKGTAFEPLIKKYRDNLIRSVNNAISFWEEAAAKAGAKVKDSETEFGYRAKMLAKYTDRVADLKDLKKAIEQDLLRQNDIEIGGNASKVVDENGEPLVVYHGTNMPFDTFDKNKRELGSNWGKGFYFTNIKDIAGDYGVLEPMAVFLNARDLLDADKLTVQELIDRVKSSAFGEKLNSLRRSNNARELSQEEIKTLQDKDIDIIGKTKNPLRALGLITEDSGGESLADGIVSDYKIANENGREYIVFEPTQIKSATDNNGEFDGTNPSILFQQPGNRLPSKEEVLGNIRQASQAGNLKGVPFAATYAKGKPYFDKLGITEEEVRDAWGEIPPVDRGDGIPPAAPGPQATVTGTERGGNTQGVPEAVPGEEPIRTPTEATPKQLIERKVAQAFRDWTVEYQDEEASVALSYHTMVNQGLIEDTEEARAEYMQKRMNIPATQTSMNALFLNSYQAFLDAGYSRADFESFIIQTLQQGGLPPTTKTVMLISAIRSFHTPGNKPFLQRSYAELGKLAAQSLNLRRLVSEDPFLSTEEVNTINGTLLRGTGTDTKAMDDAMAALDEASQEGEFADEDLVTELDPEALDAEIEELTAQLDAPDAESTISKEASEAAAAESKIITTAMEVRMEARDENGDLTTKPFKEQIIDQVNEARKLC